MKIIKLFPKTNFHTALHSDTLWGNLIYAYKLLYGEDELTNLLDDYLNGNLPFVVSSTFPFKHFKNPDSSDILFFPKPLLGNDNIQISSAEDMTLFKDFKKIQLIEQKIFEDYINGKIDDSELFKRFKLWKIEEEKLGKKDDDLIKSFKFDYIKGSFITYNLHNSIDRMSGSTLSMEGRGQLYWEEEFSFPSNDEYNYGIFFLVSGNNVSLIEPLLRLLSHLGIGGNRSIGKGAFSFTIEDFTLNFPKDSNSQILLSLYQPNNQELEILKDIQMWYNLNLRIGFISKDFNLLPQEKNPCICFTEGSTIKYNGELKGHLTPTAKTSNENSIFSNYLFLGVKANLRLQ